MKTYSYQQVYDATLSYFGGNEMVTNVWLSKYALKNNKKEFVELDPSERLSTIVSEIVRIESKYSSLTEEGKRSLKTDIYRQFEDFKYFIPGGSILFGTGNDFYLTSLGNCFVIGNQVDSYGSINLTDEEQVQLMKRRGGVGHDISHLRPKQSPVNGCASTSTGAVSFVPRYSNSTREVAQDGRRGALMLSMHINHPDIEDFITCKDDRTKNTGCNISVKITDEFMSNTKNGYHHFPKFPIDSGSVLEPDKPAREIFDKIIHQAWKNGEPGVLFWDKILSESPADCYEGFKTISTNPCGEIPLCPYDSCRLFHLNLYAYVKRPFTKDAIFDWETFQKHVQLAVRYMDDILDLEKEKIEKIIRHLEDSSEPEDIKNTELNLWRKVLEKTMQGRRLGIGVMGEADMLAALNYKYGSKESNQLSATLHKEMAKQAYIASIRLAKERGHFPIWNEEAESDNPFIQRILETLEPEDIATYHEYGRRNIALLTIAPTGTTSMLANRHGVSSGIEPVFEIAYKRRRKITDSESNARVDFIDDVGDKWEEYNVIHPAFREWYIQYWNEKNGGHWDKGLEHLSLEEIQKFIKLSPYYKSTANDIDVISKIELQGEIQKWVDHSISITHNLPETVTEEEIASYYMRAWEVGCKGITVYRDKSRAGVLVRDDNKQEEEHFQYVNGKDRPKILDCDIHRLQALRENWFIVVGLYNKLPYELFAVKEDKFPWPLRNINSKEPSFGQVIKRRSRIYDLITHRLDTKEPVLIEDLVSLLESEDDRSDTRRFSLELRHRINPKEIIETIEKQQKPITSFEKAICRVLKKYIPDGETSGLVCDECGSTNVRYEGGCPKCNDCGNSKCG